MANILLVRHGQASAGTDNYDRLSDIGIKQSEMLGAYWKQHGLQIDAAFSGSLERQQHTAKLALGDTHEHLKVQVMEDLNEYDHDTVDRLHGQGIATDVGMSLRFDQYLEIMSRWRDAPENSDFMSWNAFSQQGWNTLHAAIDEFTTHNPKHGNANLVFFTSGGVIATIFTQLQCSTFTCAMHSLWHLRNSSITHLALNQDGLSLMDYNTVPHLQMTNRAELITQI